MGNLCIKSKNDRNEIEVKTYGFGLNPFVLNKSKIIANDMGIKIVNNSNDFILFYDDILSVDFCNSSRYDTVKDSEYKIMFDRGSIHIITDINLKTWYYSKKQKLHKNYLLPKGKLTRAYV